jgi:hypothetical protein
LGGAAAAGQASRKARVQLRMKVRNFMGPGVEGRNL